MCTPGAKRNVAACGTRSRADQSGGRWQRAVGFFFNVFNIFNPAICFSLGALSGRSVLL